MLENIDSGKSSFDGHRARQTSWTRRMSHPRSEENTKSRFTDFYFDELYQQIKSFFDTYPCYLPYCSEEIINANVQSFQPSSAMQQMLMEIRESTGGYPLSPILLPSQITKLEIIVIISNALHEWIASRKDRYDDVAEKAKIIPFGSFLMDGGFVTSDLNLLLLLPKSISWFDVTTSFIKFLISKDKLTVTHPQILNGAFVPAIKFTINNVPVDMVSAHFQECKDVTKVNIYHTKIGETAHLTPKSLLALNGLRNCRALMDMVPDAAIFCHCLQVVKVWAASKAIYSSITGYLGGISLAILVANVHMSHPNTSVMGLLYSFFSEYAYHDWSKPIHLKTLDLKSMDDNQVGYLNKATSRPMCILSPMQPVQNTAFNTTVSGAALISQEFRSALHVMENISRMAESWKTLFETINFHGLYNNFLVIHIRQQPQYSCGSLGGSNESFMEEMEDFLHLVESRLRMLVVFLDVQSRGMNQFYHLYPQSFHDKTGYVYWLIGIPVQCYRPENDVIPLISLKNYFIQQLTMKMPPPSQEILSTLDLCYANRRKLKKMKKF